MDFQDPDAASLLDAASPDDLDALTFGVVGMTLDGIVERYNMYEWRLSGLPASKVLGRHFFTEVAPCTNNYLVSLRYEEEAVLDACIPYVFTLKMRPRKVELRMLKGAGIRQYLLVRER